MGVITYFCWYFIDRIHELAEREKRPLMKNIEMVFEGDEGVPIELPPLPYEDEQEDMNEQINLDRIQELEY